jgi:hypothetical protein
LVAGILLVFIVIGATMKRESRRVMGDSSHWVVKDDDPMDYDCETEDEGLGRRRKVPSRWL